ncbi:MAG: nucleotidyltransferase family protein [Chloroflexi bacterium]|nr:nucleotidyltransferase family protein [Chloroflexota bacterium]
MDKASARATAPQIPPHERGVWPVVAVVLGAGASTRMGAPKALLPWQGQPLASYVVSELLRIPPAPAHHSHGVYVLRLERIVVVVGHRAEEVMASVPVDKRVTIVVNRDWEAGKSGSVVAGLSGVPDGRHTLITGVDQPRPASVIRAVVANHLEGTSRKDGRLVTIAGALGRRGHPTIFSPLLRDDLFGIEEATLGLRAVIARHEATVHTFDTGDEMALLNLNTPEQYAEAYELHGRSDNRPPSAAPSPQPGERRKVWPRE